MRSASFFILSVSLHAAALCYPISLPGRSQAYPIAVTLLPIEHEGEMDQAGGPPVAHAAPRVAAPKAIAHAVRQKQSFNDSPPRTSADEILTPFTAADRALDSPAAQETIMNTLEAHSSTEGDFSGGERNRRFW